MTTKLSATLEVRRLNKDGTLDENAKKVCFKRDGQRFDSECTLKLLVETFYEFQASISPPLPLHSVSVQGNAVTIVEVSGQNGATYSFKWDTMKADANKRGKRSTLSLMLQFQGNLTLVLPLQVKFYKLEDEEHLSWGQALHHIEYECEQKPGITSFDILDTVFRCT